MNLTKLFKVSTKGWSGGSKETRCGYGSTLKATKSIREELPVLLEKYDIRNILDIGCGDLNWIKDIIPEDIEYYGIDWIIPDKAVKTSSKKLNLHLTEQNIFDVDNWPKVDLVICKDVLIHMDLMDATSLFWKMIDSGAKYLLITTFHTILNVDDTSAPFWKTNIDKKPFGQLNELYRIQLKDYKYLKLYKL